MNNYKKIITGVVCFGTLLLSGCVNSENTTAEVKEGITVETKESNINTPILTSISTTQFKSFTDKISKNDEKNVILDVRTLGEFEAGHIKNAIMLDIYSPSFRKNLSKLNKNKTYFIYCRSGSRSGDALKIMKKLGFTKVYNLKYGINDWVKNKFQLVK